MYAMHGRMFLGWKVINPNCPCMSESSNNIKYRIALQIKLDSMFNNYIQLDWILSKMQAFKNSASPLLTQFPC